jgi:hypothetical protein
MAEVFTIDSDDEIDPELVSDSESDDEGAKKRPTGPKKSFVFDFDDDDARDWKSAYHRNDDDDDSSEGTDEDDDADIPQSEDNVRTMPHSEDRAQRAAKKKKSSEEKFLETPSEMDEDDEAEYFEDVVDANTGDGNAAGEQFSELGLSRPLLRGVQAAGYVTPTPVQSAGSYCRHDDSVYFSIYIYTYISLKILSMKQY